ncbi:MAG TPA: Rieske 2Fe-2S domain-containing protein, partial [Streptosporangiaceae bacterium]|nr:Rieske 2Fe-2S domain-containing protein [Streptosporangiaceae bacterium]
MTPPGVFANLRAQRACWHPVAFAADLADQPLPADLLGEPLVLWRGRDGSLRVLSDLCVHRGTALSLGRIDGGELVCAYHGWRYAADGRCVAIPQLEMAWMWGALLAASMAAWLHQLTARTAGEDILAGHGVRSGKAMIATLRRRLIAVPGRLILCRSNTQLGCLTCTVADRLDTMVVSWAGAVQ